MDDEYVWYGHGDVMWCDTNQDQSTTWKMDIPLSFFASFPFFLSVCVVSLTLSLFSHSPSSPNVLFFISCSVVSLSSLSHRHVIQQLCAMRCVVCFTSVLCYF